MTLMVSTEDNKLTVSGAGQWAWTDEHRLDDVQFSSEHRLAEPAFVRGIQLKSLRLPSVLKSIPAAPRHSDQHHVLLHSSLPDNCIVKGESSAVGRKVFIKPSETEQYEHRESIIDMVFEQEKQQETMLGNYFKEL